MAARYLVLVLAALLGACGGEAPGAPSAPVAPRGAAGPEPGDPSDGAGALDGITLSAPVPTVGDESAVYVGAIPGARPGARRAFLRNPRTAETREVAAVDGGFDPVPLGAVEGDLIALVVEDSAGSRATSEAFVRRPSPRLVRSAPRTGRTDVPLNVRIEVVFSTPMDATSLAQGVSLWSQGSRVAAAVTQEAPGLALSLSPEAPLVPGATYELRIAGSVRDVLGEPLERGEVVTFRVAEPVPTLVESLRLVPARHNVPGWDNPEASVFWQPRALFVGDTLWLKTSARAGGAAEPVTVAASWSSSSTAILRVESSADEMGAIAIATAPGAAVVSASAGGAAASWSTQVYERMSASELASRWLYVFRDGEIFRQRADGLVSESIASLPYARFEWDSYLRYFPWGHDWRLAGVHPVAGVAVRHPDGVQATPFGGQPRALPTSGDDSWCPTWSPDGEMLVTTVQQAMLPWPGGDLVRLYYDGLGSERMLGWQSGALPTCPVWHPSQEYVVVTHGSGPAAPAGVSAWSLRLDGSPAALMFSGLLAGPFAPDGASLLVVDAAGDLHVADTSGALLRRIAGVARIAPVAWSSDGALVAMPFYLISADGRYAADVNGEILGFAP